MNLDDWMRAWPFGLLLLLIGAPCGLIAAMVEAAERKHQQRKNT